MLPRPNVYAYIFETKVFCANWALIIAYIIEQHDRIPIYIQILTLEKINYPSNIVINNELN